jgi:hypothetical protein
MDKRFILMSDGDQLFLTDCHLVIFDQIINSIKQGFNPKNLTVIDNACDGMVRSWVEFMYFWGY